MQKVDFQTPYDAPADGYSAPSGPPPLETSDALARGEPWSPPPSSSHLLLKVYKAPGIFSRNDFITGEDKQLIQYYLEFPRKVFSAWDLTLKRGGKEGPMATRIQKDVFSNDFTLTMASGWTTSLARTGLLARTHESGSFDGQTRDRWKRDGVFSSNWSCINQANDGLVATWRRTIAF